MAEEVEVVPKVLVRLSLVSKEGEGMLEFLPSLSRMLRHPTPL